MYTRSPVMWFYGGKRGYMISFFPEIACGQETLTINEVKKIYIHLKREIF